MSQDSSVDIGTSYGLQDRGSIPSKDSVQRGSGASQPPNQWEPGALSLGLNGRAVKLTTNLLLVPRPRMVELYLHSPKCLHGIVLN
jgi:hypothetical protein